MNPPRPVFFIQPKPEPQQVKEGAKGRTNQYTGQHLFVYLLNCPIFAPIQIMLNTLS